VTEVAIENKTEINKLVCQNCKNILQTKAAFCQYCGKQVSNYLIQTNASKQILVYLVSFFLPPFGLIYAYKYLKQGDSKSKKIAYLAIALTITSIGISLWVSTKILNTLSTQLNNQVNSYQQLGF